MVDTVTPPTSTDIKGLQAHIVQLEQTVSDMQTKYQTQEQKYTAVLQTVLSKLASTKDELTDWKNEYNISLTRLTSEVDTLKSDLQLCVTSVKSGVMSLNSTLQSLEEELMDKLNISDQHPDSVKPQVVSQHGNSLSDPGSSCPKNLRGELEDLRLNLSNIHNALKERYISFEVSLTKNRSTGLNVLKFDRVILNVGGGYRPNRGVFIAPIGGTYLFWCHVTNNEVKRILRVVLKRNGIQVGYGATPSEDHYGAVSVTTVLHLKAADNVNFLKISEGSIRGDNLSSYGGTLIRPDID